MTQIYLRNFRQLASEERSSLVWIVNFFAHFIVSRDISEISLLPLASIVQQRETLWAELLYNRHVINRVDVSFHCD